jgi:hypothetical protein
MPQVSSNIEPKDSDRGDNLVEKFLCALEKKAGNCAGKVYAAS